MGLIASFQRTSEDIDEIVSVEWLASISVEDAMFAERRASRYIVGRQLLKDIRPF